MKITASILDYSYPGIPTDIWNSDGTLLSYHKDFILKLLNSFYKNYDLKQSEQWVSDVIVIGSLTTNKFMRTSDFDCHIVVNISKFIETNMPKATPQKAMDKLDEIRYEFDRARMLMPMGNHVLEFFIESPDITPTGKLPSNKAPGGIYSILTNKWLKEPLYFAQEADMEISRKKAIEEAKELAGELDVSFGEIGRQIQRIDELKEVLQAWPKEKQRLYYDKIQKKLAIIEEEIEKSISLKQELVDGRQATEDRNSDNEIEFKFLGRFHYFNIINELQWIVGEEAEVTTESLPLIEKVISEASLNKVASTYGYWVDPSGKRYETDDHDNWIIDNAKLLKDNYGIKINIYNRIDVEKFSAKNGWVRIVLGSPLLKKSTIYIFVPNIKNIPSFVDDIILESNRKNIAIEDITRAGGELPLDEVINSGIQKAVNRALSHKRLQIASLDKQAGSVIDVNGVRVYKNPIKEQVKQLWYNSKDNSLRYIQNYNDFYIWDAYYLTHDQMKKALGLESNVSRMGYIENEKEIQAWPNLIQYTSSLKQAFLKEAFEEEKLVLAIDFDDTLAKENPDNTIGEPEPGAKEALIKLQNDGYILEIYSHRANTDEGADEIKAWMEKYEIPYDSILQVEKPEATYYIDNRGIHFTNWDEVLKQVEKSDKTASLRIVSNTQQVGSIFEGLAYRSPTGYEHNNTQTAKNVLNYEMHELGNNLGTPENILNILDKYPASQLVWVTKFKSHAKRYGTPELYKLPSGSLIVGTDGDEGYLVLKGPVDKTASLCIIAYDRAQAASWIDPNGKAYYLDDENIPTHMVWILEHIEFLRDEYGYSDVQTYLNDIDRSHNDVDYIDGYLNSKGWSRIGDTGHSEFGIEVSDISDIPQGLLTYLISMPWDDKLNFYIEDSGGAYVQVNLGELRTEGQKAVNRALSHKRLQTASLNKQAGSVIDVNGVRVFKDPTFEQMENLFEKSQENFPQKSNKHLRYILSPETNELFVWDAFDQHHTPIAEGLGINLDVETYDNYAGDILSVYDIESVFEQQDKMKLQPVSSLKQAFLKEAFGEEKERPKEFETDICIDLDKTLAQDAEYPEIGEPIEGAKESLVKLKEMGYNIVIYSCRNDSEEGLELVHEWLDKYEMPYDSIFEGNKPFFKYVIDDKAIHFDNWESVLKQVEKSDKTASLHIVSASRYWVDPSGKVYPVKTTHEDWFFENKDLLQKQYGYVEDTVGQSWWDIKTINLLRQLLNDGWLRVGDLFNISGEGTNYGSHFIGQGIEVADINNLPDSFFNFISQFDKDKYFLIEDLRKRYVELSVEELMSDGQEAVNRAMQRGKMVHAALSQKYWIDPSGKEYAIDNKLGHYGWIVKNLLHQSGKVTWKNYPDMEDKATEMIQEGWTRITTESDRGADFGIEVANLKRLPSYLDDFISQHYTGNGLELDDLNGEYAVVADPFPTIQKSVNRAMMMAKRVQENRASKAFSKKEIIAIGKPSSWLMDPKGKLYPTINDDHEATAEKLFHKSVYDLLPLGWTTVRAIGNNMSIAVNKLNRIPNTVDDLLARSNVKTIAIIPADADLEGLPEPPRVDYEDAIEHGIQKAVNRDIMRMRNMPKTAEQKSSTIEYACVMGDIPKEISQEIVEFGVRNIKDEDLYTENNLGRELDSHITIKYGIISDDPKEVKRLFKNVKPFKATLGEVKHFSPPEREYDVLTVAVECKELEDMNEKITKELKCATGLPSDEYHSHITIAYIKKGTCKDLYGNKEFVGKEIVIDSVEFSPVKGDKSTISLGTNEKDAAINSLTREITAAFSDSVWIDPKGKIYKIVNSSHEDWALENEESLSKNYGIKWNSSYATVDLLHNGWTRVGDIGVGETGFGIEMNDLYRVPSFVFDYIFSNLGQNDLVALADEQNRFIELPVKDFVNGQKDLNRELMLNRTAAYRGNMDIWLASDGQEFMVTRSHTIWIVDEANLLKQEYGLSLPAEGSPEDDNLIAWLLSKGWVRVSGVLPTELDLLIQDINNIPQAAEQFVWKYKPEVVIVEDLNGSDTSFDREEYSKGMMKKAEFLPSLFPAPDNKWTPDSDKEIAVNVDPISDDSTLYGEWWQDKPRNPEAWRMFISMFSKPISKKDEMTVDSAYDPELEEAESKAMGEEPLLEYSKGFYDPKKYDFPHNTTMDSPQKLPNQHEPYSPLPVTLDMVQNPENNDQNSPGGFPGRFCQKPKSIWFSNSGEITDALKNMWKNKKASIEEFPLAGNSVDGRTVRNEVPNQSSIGASLTDYTILKGIREVPFSAFTQMPALSYYSTDEEKRTKTLVEQIKQTGEITPLIVAIDAQGPYILEGGHRFDALRELGANSFPAMVVLDDESIGQVKQASSNVFPVSIDNGPDNIVYKNPSLEQIKNILRRAKEQEVRYFTDPKGNTYVWDSYTMTHAEFREYLGLPFGDYDEGIFDNVEEYINRIASMNKEAAINSLTIDITAGEKDGVWVAPDGQAYNVHDHLRWVYENIMHSPKIPKGQLASSIIEPVADRLLEEGWVRLRVFDSSLFVTVDNIAFIKNAENEFFKLLPLVKEIEVYDSDNNIYRTTSKEFKQQGWDSFARIPNKEAAINSLTREITAILFGGWMSPDGRVFETEDHFSFVGKHLKLFNLEQFKDYMGGKGYEFNEAMIKSEPFILDQGWIRYRVWGGNLLVQAKSFEDAHKLENEIFKVLPDIRKIRIEDLNENSYEATAEEFKERGWDAFSKQPVMASLEKEASYTHAYWIDPNGKVFQVRGGDEEKVIRDLNLSNENTHGAWIIRNFKMLEEQYGLKDINSSADLIRSGWIRVGDAFGTDWGITVADTSKIPSFVDNLLAQFAPEGSVITVATPGSYGANYTFEWPVKSIQQTVNQIKNRRQYYQKQPVMAKQADKNTILYHGTSDIAWKNKGNKKDTLYLVNDLNEAWNYAYEAAASLEGEGIKVNPIVLQVDLSQIASNVEMLPDHGWSEYTEDKTWEDSLNAVGSMSVYGNIEELKPYFKLIGQKKQAGSYSASVPDYQGEQYYNEQHMDNADEIPYINKDLMDNGYGFHDWNSSTTDYPKPADISPYVVRLDILYPGPDRPYPAGMMDYEVINMYDSLPMSDGIEKSNPD